MTLRRDRPSWLDRVYRLPDPFATLDEWQRARHEDLATLSPDEVENERIRVRLRLAFERAPDAWLTQRLERLRAAQRRGRR